MSANAKTKAAKARKRAGFRFLRYKKEAPRNGRGDILSERQQFKREIRRQFGAMSGKRLRALVKALRRQEREAQS